MAAIKVIFGVFLCLLVVGVGILVWERGICFQENQCFGAVRLPPSFPPPALGAIKVSFASEGKEGDHVREFLTGSKVMRSASLRLVPARQLSPRHIAFFASDLLKNKPLWAASAQGWLPISQEEEPEKNFKITQWLWFDGNYSSEIFPGKVSSDLPGDAFWIVQGEKPEGVEMVWHSARPTGRGVARPSCVPEKLFLGKGLGPLWQLGGLPDVLVTSPNEGLVAHTSPCRILAQEAPEVVGTNMDVSYGVMGALELSDKSGQKEIWLAIRSSQNYTESLLWIDLRPGPTSSGSDQGENILFWTRD